MKWWLIWICASCGFDDATVVYAGHTEAHVEAVAKELRRSGQDGTWLVAEMIDGFEHEKMEIWNGEKSRFDVRYLGATRPSRDVLTLHRR